MKINEVEALVGITKKNIRFYEAEGLLTPRRNSDNGYRDYGEAEVETLRQIKLLRKLGLPLEEIRQMLSGTHTLGDGMRRHLVTLEREQKNLETSMALCRQLKDREEPLSALDAQALLEEMELLEHQGATFLNRQTGDARRMRRVAPAVVMVALMASLMALMIWGFTTDADQAPPLPLVVVLVAIPGVIILGVVLALIQRLQEIEKGEIDDARKY